MAPRVHIDQWTGVGTMTEQEFSHLDGDGRLQMVDVSTKATTHRVARASCLVVGDAEHEVAGAPTDHLVSARLAGVRAAKRTSELIPLCHPIFVSSVHVDVDVEPRGYRVFAEVVTDAPTGVEMEALTACSFAALTLIATLVEDHPTARMTDLALLSKSGGASGDWGRDVAAE